MHSILFAVVVSLVLSATSLKRADAQVDLTMAVNASGTNVVLATISIIDGSNVFTDNNRFLRRVAYAESRDGLDPDTFRDGYNGGIWQVDEEVFLRTMDRATFPFLVEPGGIYERLLQSDLNLDWAVAVWEDLRKPLISAVAARIFFELAEDDIPNIGDVEGQGDFWKSTGFNTNDADTVELFMERITNLELEECPNRGIDLAFVLDSSGSVGEANFALERELVSSVVQRFDVGLDATRVAVISFSGFAVINFNLGNFSTQEDVLQAVSEVEYFDIPVETGAGMRTSTNTADALIRLRTEVFTLEGGARSADVAIPRVAVVITDGRSNINASLTIPSALALREGGTTVYSVGVGGELNMDELLAIASSPDNVQLLEGFDGTEFDGLRSSITNDACLAAVPIAIAQTINIELDFRETSFFEYEVPDEGMTVTLVQQEGTASLFASSRVQNPNSALYDYRIDGEGEVFVDLEELIGERERRESGSEGGPTMLFVSVEGAGMETNSFQIMTSAGNTIQNGCKLHGPNNYIILFLLALTFVLLQLVPNRAPSFY